MRCSWLWGNGSNSDLTVITCHVIGKSCQKIAFVEYHSLSTVVCEDHLADPDTVYVFDNPFGVFGGGTRLAMPKTILHAGLIVIEAWFRGY